MVQIVVAFSEYLNFTREIISEEAFLFLKLSYYSFTNTYWKKSLNVFLCLHQINSLYWVGFLVNAGSQFYHFQTNFFLTNIKDKYLAFFKPSLAKMVTLTTNIVYKNPLNIRNLFGLHLPGPPPKPEVPAPPLGWRDKVTMDDPDAKGCIFISPK